MNPVSKFRGNRSAPALRAILLLSGLSIAVLSACGGGSVSTTPLVSASVPPVTALASATNTVCVTPNSSAPQSVNLPATGGISATITFGAYPAGATGCDSVTIATGADVATTQSFLRSGQNGVRETSATTTTAPLLTISVGAAFGGSGPVSAFGYQTIVSGMQLMVSSNLNFPDGTYYATVTASGKTFIIPFTATGGVLSVAGGTAGLPVLILAGSSALITLYPQGVMPPASTPSPSPSATASASASPTSSATASPTAAASAGQPVPDGTTIGTSTLTIEGQPNNSNGTMITTPIVYEASYPLFAASVLSGAILPGIVTYTISGLNVASYRVEGCTGQVGYAGNGVHGTFTVPFGVTFQFSDTCAIDLFSAPASVVNAAPNNGFGYAVYAVIGPVSQTLATYPPAVDVH
jgi:hypothetical protein